VTLSGRALLFVPFFAPLFPLFAFLTSVLAMLKERNVARKKAYSVIRVQYTL